MKTPQVSASSARARDRLHGQSGQEELEAPRLTEEQLVAMSLRTRHDWLSTTGHRPGEMSEDAWRALAERSLQRFLEALHGPLVIGASRYVGRVEPGRYFHAFRDEYLSRFPDMNPNDKASLDALIKRSRALQRSQNGVWSRLSPARKRHGVERPHRAGS